MRDSIHKYFKVGTIHFMSFPATMRGEGPIEETVHSLLTDDYFDAVEFTWMKDAAVRAKVADMIKVSGITPCYGAQPRFLTTGLNPNDLQEENRLKAEASLLEAIDEAEELGCKGVAFLSGKYDEVHKHEAYDQLLKTTLTACAYAKQRGMSIELEVFDFDVDKRSLIGPAPYAAQFAAEVRCHTDNFGLVVDLSHIPQTHESSRFALQTMRPFITHLHFGTAVLGNPANTAYGDTHTRFNFPNSANGTEELAAYLNCLKEEGFFREDDPMVLSLEVKPWEDEDPMLVLANTKRVLNRAWALVKD